MSNTLRLRRGTAAQHTTFVGSEAEITYVTDNRELRLHDGETEGGIVLPMDPVTDAAALDGSETLAIKQSGGSVKLVLTKIAQFVLQTYKGFTQVGTGALARTVLSKLQESVSLADFTGYDGTGATNSDAAFLSAIAALPKGGRIVIPPGAKLSLATALVVNQPITLWAAVRGDISANTNGGGPASSSPSITWKGAAGATMFKVAPATVGQSIWGGGAVGIEFDGNGLAGTAVHLDNTKFGEVDVKVRNVTAQAVLVNSASGTTGNFSQNNKVNLEFIWGVAAACQNAHGVVLAGNGTNVPATQQLVGAVVGLIYNGNMVQIAETDNSRIDFINSSVQAGGTGTALYVKNVGAQPANHTICNHIAGPIKFDNGLLGTKIVHYVSEAGGITQTSGTSYYDAEMIDYVNGRVYKTHTFKLLHKLELPANSFAGDSGMLTGTKYGLQWNALAFQDGVDSSVACCCPAPYDFDAGLLTGIELFIASNGTAGSNYRFEIRASAVTPEVSGGPGAVTPAQTVNITVAAGAQYTLKKYSIPFTAPIAYKQGDSIFVQIIRHGLDAADTNNENAFFLGARVLYTGTGPASPGSGTYALPPI